MKIKFKNKGFSLMEIIIAIGVIITALVGSVALISYSISSTRLSRSRITAQGLAQEGLEIVRNIRDNNWLAFKRKASDWRDGLLEGNWRVEYDKLQLLPDASSTLMLDPSGFYFYQDQGIRTGSVVTPFQRRVGIEYIGDNQIKATSEIIWQEYGRNNSLKVETRLYNWLEEPEP
jgi:type II secretory pathway pseudopilin PulG